MQIDRELFMYSAMKYPSNKQLLAIVEVIKVTWTWFLVHLFNCIRFYITFSYRIQRYQKMIKKYSYLKVTDFWLVTETLLSYFKVF